MEKIISFFVWIDSKIHKYIYKQWTGFGGYWISYGKIGQRAERKRIIDFMREKYKNRNDKDNMFGVGVSDAEFRQFIIDYLLGEDWYVVDPLGQTQVNEIALYEILEKYSKRFRKETKNDKRRNNRRIRNVYRW